MQQQLTSSPDCAGYSRPFDARLMTPGEQAAQEPTQAILARLQESDSITAESYSWILRAIGKVIDTERAKLALQGAASIDLVLFCPVCGKQHIDAPEPDTGWTNPPHRSHLCANCGTVWRPADVHTNGVALTSTTGAGDTFRSYSGWAAQADADGRLERST